MVRGNYGREIYYSFRSKINHRTTHTHTHTHIHIDRQTERARGGGVAGRYSNNEALYCNNDANQLINERHVRRPALINHLISLIVNDNENWPGTKT